MKNFKKLYHNKNLQVDAFPTIVINKKSTTSESNVFHVLNFILLLPHAVVVGKSRSFFLLSVANDAHTHRAVQLASEYKRERPTTFTSSGSTYIVFSLSSSLIPRGRVASCLLQCGGTICIFFFFTDKLLKQTKNGKAKRQAGGPRAA